MARIRFLDPDGSVHEIDCECDMRCFRARRPRCNCRRCGGKNHGLLSQMLGEGERRFAVIPDGEIRRIFTHCLACGHQELEVLGYPHDGGLLVPEFGTRMWVFGRCMRCGYDSVWWKYILRGSETVIAEPEVRVEGP